MKTIKFMLIVRVIQLVFMVKMILVNALRANAYLGNNVRAGLGSRLSRVARWMSTSDTDKVYLNVPFAEKDEVRSLGGRWDMEAKKWYINNEDSRKEEFAKWIFDANSVFWLKVPFSEKDEVKSLGARWDKEKSKWFIPGGASWTPFARWIPKEVLFLGVETSGLPPSTYPPHECTKDYDVSRIVQLNAVLCDPSNNFTERGAVTAVIKSDGFPISNSQFHGITEEICQKQGVAFAAAAAQLNKLLARKPLILAHNSQFHVSILKAELYRYGLTDTLSSLLECPVLCSMAATKGTLGLKDVGGNPKNPTLRELYAHATNTPATTTPTAAEAGAVAGARTNIDQLVQAVKSMVEAGTLKI